MGHGGRRGPLGRILPRAPGRSGLALPCSDGETQGTCKKQGPLHKRRERWEKRYIWPPSKLREGGSMGGKRVRRRSKWWAFSQTTQTHLQGRKPRLSWSNIEVHSSFFRIVLPSIILPKLSVTNCLTAGVVVQSCHTLWQRHATTSTRTAATGWTKMVLKSAMQIWIYIYIYFGLASSYSAFVVERYPQVGDALLKTELLDYLEKWLLSCMQWILCSASCLLLCAAEQDYCRAE